MSGKPRKKTEAYVAAHRRSSAKYKQLRTVQVLVTFNRNTEPTLTEFIEGYEGNRPALLRECLRAHLAAEAEALPLTGEESE